MVIWPNFGWGKTLFNILEPLDEPYLFFSEKSNLYRILALLFKNKGDRVHWLGLLLNNLFVLFWQHLGLVNIVDNYLVEVWNVEFARWYFAINAPGDSNCQHFIVQLHIRGNFIRRWPEDWKYRLFNLLTRKTFISLSGELLHRRMGRILFIGRKSVRSLGFKEISVLATPKAVVYRN